MNSFSVSSFLLLKSSISILLLLYLVVTLSIFPALIDMGLRHLLKKMQEARLCGLRIRVATAGLNLCTHELIKLINFATSFNS